MKLKGVAPYKRSKWIDFNVYAENDITNNGLYETGHSYMVVLDEDNGFSVDKLNLNVYRVDDEYEELVLDRDYRIKDGSWCKEVQLEDGDGDKYWEYVALKPGETPHGLGEYRVTLEGIEPNFTGERQIYFKIGLDVAYRSKVIVGSEEMSPVSSITPDKGYVVKYADRRQYKKARGNMAKVSWTTAAPTTVGKWVFGVFESTESAEPLAGETYYYKTIVKLNYKRVVYAGDDNLNPITSINPATGYSVKYVRWDDYDIIE